MKEQAQARTPQIIAVETAVVDLQYDGEGGDQALKDEFFSQLKELIAEGGNEANFRDNPRPGDMRLIAAEDFDGALIAFGRRHNLLGASVPHLTPREQALLVSQQLFGTPAPVAGGSLANTFHALVNATIDSQKLVGGHFVTAVGDDPSGAVFSDSLAGNIHHATRGRQMECHVYPVDNDRILIAAPAKDDPADGHIRPVLFDQCPLTGRDRIMLGGFLFFTEGFHEIYDAVIVHLNRMPAEQKPVIVVTAAAQAVAAGAAFQEKLAELITRADVTIHCNTGEFRRLLSMDTEWRKPFDADFAGLDGQALEDVKSAHAAYKKAKSDANDAAIKSAVSFAGKVAEDWGKVLRFVVTDGPRNTYVISADGCEAFTPDRIDKSKIVNTVGAGDNFAAGFQLGDLYGLPYRLCVDLGHDFAQAVIQQPAARLDASRRKNVAALDGNRFELGGALSYFNEGHLSDVARDVLFGQKKKQGPKL